MIKFQTITLIPHATSKQVTDFFINCPTSKYKEWWPGTHLEFYTITRTKNNIGNIIYMDEYVGKHRLKFKARISKYKSGKIIEYQFMKGLLLPAWLTMEFKNTPNGVTVKHTVRIGYNGFRKCLDVFIKLYFSNVFEQELNKHAKTEFIKLGNLLNQQK